MQHRKLTQQQLTDEARERFGDNALTWAFKCPNCGDVASAADFPEDERQAVGQHCIGRHLGAVEADTDQKWQGRGCSWAAYGLFRGPWEIVMPDGSSAYAFPLAELEEVNNQ